jgi:hypothetical protein
MVTAIASAVGAVVGIVLAQQFPDYAKYGFIGALLGAALGTIPYVMGRFALKTAKLRHSIAFGVLLGFLAGLAITPWLVAREFDDALEQASATLNQQCPKRIDIVTRIDGSSVAPGRKFIYRYTILPDNAFNPDELQAKLRPALIKSWETNPSIDLYRQMGVTLEYEYFTQDKHPLATITFNANEVPKE